MGLVPGSDYETAGSCIYCFGPAFEITYGPGYLLSPKYVKAVVSGTTPCPVDGISADGEYLMTWGEDCRWLGTTGDFSFSFRIYDYSYPYAFSSFFLVHNPSGKFGFIGNGDPCDIIFNNAIVLGSCGGNNGAYDGQAIMTWGPGIHP